MNAGKQQQHPGRRASSSHPSPARLLSASLLLLPLSLIPLSPRYSVAMDASRCFVSASSTARPGALTAPRRTSFLRIRPRRRQALPPRPSSSVRAAVRSRSGPPSDSVAPVPFRPVPAEAASPEPLHRAAAPLLYLLLPLFFSNEQQLARLVSPLTTPGQRACRSGPGPAPAPRSSALLGLLHRPGLSPW